MYHKYVTVGLWSKVITIKFKFILVNRFQKENDMKGYVIYSIIHYNLDVAAIKTVA